MPKKPRGELFIHPTLWRRLFPDPKMGALCPLCRMPVFAMTPVKLEPTERGLLICHNKCPPTGGGPRAA